MSIAEQKFVEFLRRTGMKVTASRRLILEEAFRSHDHFDAEDLYLRLQRKHSGVSRATVYRTLALLMNSGLIHRVELGESRSRYEHVLGHPHHDHLICIQCGKILEFQHPRIEAMQAEICQQFDFKMVSHTQQIYGICQNCRENRQSEA